MTKTEMEDAVKNCDHRLSALEEILPALATKQDLERFATKQDLERFATKQDLDRLATKQDLERFATKQDLDRLATKVVVESLRDDIHKVAEGYASLCVTTGDISTTLATLIKRLERKGVI